MERGPDAWHKTRAEAAASRSRKGEATDRAVCNSFVVDRDVA